MKTFFAILVFLASLGYVNASSFFPADTTFHYQNRMVVIREQPDEINVSVYRCNEAGDTIRSNKIYEGIFTDNKSVEVVMKTGLTYSSPIFLNRRKNAK